MPVSVANLVLTSGGVRRLDGVSFCVDDGVTAVVGYSGAGKTSLLNVLAAFEPADSGEFCLPANHGGGRLPLFWLPQSAGLWNHLTVEQHLLAVRSAQISAQFQISSDEILRQLDLHHRRSALPGELSQGEKSRLGIARALASSAGVLLLDEPLVNVDVARRDQYWSFMRTVFQQMQTTVVFASHDPAAVVRESVNVICMNDGRVVHCGSTRELYDTPPTQTAGEFLGRLNWFTPEECRLWLSGRGPQQVSSDGFGVRPENLSIVTDSENGMSGKSRIEVIETVFAGATCETILQDQTTGLQRTVVHRAADLKAGQRVILHVGR